MRKWDGLGSVVSLIGVNGRVLIVHRVVMGARNPLHPMIVEVGSKVVDMYRLWVSRPLPIAYSWQRDGNAVAAQPGHECGGAGGQGGAGGYWHLGPAGVWAGDREALEHSRYTISKL